MPRIELTVEPVIVRADPGGGIGLPDVLVGPRARMEAKHDKARTFTCPSSGVGIHGDQRGNRTRRMGQPLRRVSDEGFEVTLTFMPQLSCELQGVSQPALLPICRIAPVKAGRRKRGAET